MMNSASKMMNFAFKRNKTRTMTAARGDGWVLKPDRALSTQCDLEGADSCFKNGDPTCHTFYTYSDHDTGKVG